MSDAGEGSSAAARCALAELLVRCGAGASAGVALGALRGAHANRLRARAARAGALAPGVYAMTALRCAGEGSGEGSGDGSGEGVLLPLRAEPGVPMLDEALAREAVARALALVCEALGAREAPSLRFALDEAFFVEGASLGLPAALAFARRLCAPRVGSTLERSAVLATGALDDDGAVRPVGGLEAKARAARAAEGVGAALVPAGAERCEGFVALAARGVAAEPVRALDEALARVLGPGPHALDAGLLRFEARFARLRDEPDAERAAAGLRALLDEALRGGTEVDAARVRFELGTRLRHAGRTGEALALHRRAAEALAGPARAVVGAEAAERYELERWATELHEFALEGVVATLRARLDEPFLHARNEVRARGMLAQALGLAGNYEAALRVREANLPLHALGAALREVLPGTLAALALDAARAGQREAFARYARRALEGTPAGAAVQARYNAASVARGLVALGCEGDALAWAQGEALPAWGLARDGSGALRWARPGATGPVRTHPEVSVARALVRAYASEARLEEARSLAARVEAPARGGGVAPSEDLLAWTAALVRLELGLALRRAGDEAQGLAVCAAARDDLRRAHAAATRAHPALASDDPEALAQALVRSWY